MCTLTARLIRGRGLSLFFLNNLDSRVKTKGGWFFILGFNMLNFQICQTQPNMSNTISIGTCSSDLYIDYFFETSGTASCGTTGIGLAFTFVTFVIFMLIRLNPDTLCTIPDGRVPSSQAPSFHRESRSTRGDGNFGNLHDFYIFFLQARAVAKRHAEEHAREAARTYFFFLRDLHEQLLSVQFMSM